MKWALQLFLCSIYIMSSTCPFSKGFITEKYFSLPQNIKVELESVQEELSGTRKDKFMLQAKVGELRNSMKTVLLQNQQLKQDLKQSRLRKVIHLTCH